MKTQLLTLGTAALLASLAACSHSKGWEVKGEVYGAENSKISLEALNNGRWYVVDSLDVDARGNFAYKSAEAAAYPEIMRLSYDGRSIYFPVDSVDHITVSTSAADFGRTYQLSGTADAESVRQLDSIINVAAASAPADTLVTDQALKRRLLTKALEAESVIPAYYLVNKTVGNKPLFNMGENADVRLFGAVAQRFITERPTDPRAEAIKAQFLQAQRAMRPATVTEISVPETGLFDIVRHDEQGRSQSLAELASKGGVTVLSFTRYGNESSPTYNVILNQVWEKYHSAGLNIYQIAYDGDETSWQETARNLPWVTVWNGTTGGTEPLEQYNVGVLPTTFVIDRSGSLNARVTDPAKLEAAVAKLM